ncbi:type I toxin-antitoxin system Fst family toxin [Staphylococcus sp. FSL W8-0774]
MFDTFVQFTITVISGCIIALFTEWLRHRNDK